jgi:hypothetical protein
MGQRHPGASGHRCLRTLLTLERRFSSLTLRPLGSVFHLGGSPMNQEKDSVISRREFARRAAIVSAAASLAPANLLRAEPVAALPQPQQTSAATNLSPEGQAEVDSRIQSILAQYGGRLSDAQKTDLRRLATEAQPPLDRLRAFTVENGDGPALYLRPLIEREAKPAPKPSSPAGARAPKKP